MPDKKPHAQERRRVCWMGGAGALNVCLHARIMTGRAHTKSQPFRLLLLLLLVISTGPKTTPLLDPLKPRTADPEKDPFAPPGTEPSGPCSVDEPRHRDQRAAAKPKTRRASVAAAEPFKGAVTMRASPPDLIWLQGATGLKSGVGLRPLRRLRLGLLVVGES